MICCVTKEIANFFKWHIFSLINYICHIWPKHDSWNKMLHTMFVRLIPGVCQFHDNPGSTKLTMIWFYFRKFYKPMREIIIKINTLDYLDFQKIANESSLTVEQKIHEIIRYYLIIERNRKKFTQKLLW